MNMPIRLTPAVKGLLIACFATFIVQQTVDQFFGGNFLGYFGLLPGAVLYSFHIWQLFTYSFLHADVIHVFFNLMMLAFIGAELEQTWGTARFLRYYFFCTTIAALFYIFLQLILKTALPPMVGASGGIYGLLMAYGLIFGERVMLFMMLFPLKAKHFVWILAAIEFLTSIFAGRGGLASIAHLAGMGAGFAYLWGRATWTVMQKQRLQAVSASQRSKRLKNSGHLKLVKGEMTKKGSGPDGTDDNESDNPRTWH
jgi:membrane associated rhomboid family serine protease